MDWKDVWERPKAPDVIVAPTERPAPPRHRDPGAQRRSDLSRVARDGIIKLAGSVIAGIFGFLFVIIVTRKLGPGGTGAFYEGIALYLIASSLSKLGADVGLIRMIPRYLSLGRIRDLRPTIWIALTPVFVMGVLLGIAMFVLAPQLASIVAKGRHSDLVAPYIRVLAPFVVFTAASTVITSGTRGFHTMIPLVVINNIARPIVRPVAALVVIALGLGGLAIALSYAVPVAIGSVAALAWLLVLLGRAERKSDRSRRRHTVGKLASEFWRFAGPRAFAAIFATTVTWLDTLLLGGLRGTVDAGVYAASTRYINLGSFALTVLFLAVSPLLSSVLAEEDHGRAESMYQTTTSWLTLSSWPIYIMLAVFAPFVLGVFGDAFVAGQTALMTLSLAQLFAMAAGPATTVLLMGGHSVLNTINTVVALLLNIGLNLLLIPKYGLEGAAIAWTISIVANNLAAIIELRIWMKLSPIGPGLGIVAAGSALCFGAIGVAARLAFGAGWTAFLLTGVVGGALYLLLLWRYREILQLTVLRDALTSRAKRKLRKSGGERPTGDDGIGGGRLDLSVDTD